MVLKRSALAKDFVTGGQDSVGLRVPSHPVAQALLREFDGGVAAPSANRFGNLGATTAAHVVEEMDVEFVLDGGPSEVGIESTIVDLSGVNVVLLRPGRISKGIGISFPPFRARRSNAPWSWPPGGGYLPQSLMRSATGDP